MRTVLSKGFARPNNRFKLNRKYTRSIYYIFNIYISIIISKESKLIKNKEEAD